MRNGLFICVAVLGIASCTPLSIYYREGVPVATMEKALLNCRVDALEKAPVATQTRRGPPYYVRGYRHCNKSGHCYTRGGYYVPGDLYTVDVNSGLRRDVETQCMAAQGYQPVTIPNCPAGAPPTGSRTNVSSTPNGAGTDRLPPLTEQTCAVRSSDGQWQIITPAP